MRTLAEIEQLFPGPAEAGLSAAGAEESAKRFGLNRLTPLPREPLWKKFVEKFDEPIIKILLAAALLSMFVDLFAGNLVRQDWPDEGPQLQLARGRELGRRVAQRAQDFCRSQWRSAGLVRRKPDAQAEHRLFEALALRLIERFDVAGGVVQAICRQVQQPQLLFQPRQLFVS